MSVRRRWHPIEWRRPSAVGALLVLFVLSFLGYTTCCLAWRWACIGGAEQLPANRTICNRTPVPCFQLHTGIIGNSRYAQQLRKQIVLASREPTR